MEVKNCHEVVKLALMVVHSPLALGCRPVVPTQFKKENFLRVSNLAVHRSLGPEHKVLDLGMFRVLVTGN